MIVGITGSFGAGKGAVVSYLVSQKKFTHYSASGFLTEEIRRRKLFVDRNAMILIANELRARYGPAYIIESLYERAKLVGGNVVIEALRAKAEVTKIKELGGVVIGVDADTHVRYSRTSARGSEKDHVSYEEWLQQEQQESNPDDPAKQDIFGALKESDFIIVNDGTLKELHAQIDKILHAIDPVRGSIQGGIQ